MSLQFMILKNKLKKCWFWIGLFFVITFLCLIFYYFRPMGLNVTKNDFLILFAYPKYYTSSFLAFLVTIYQVVLHIYIIYTFFSYVFYNSYENIILRVNEKKWLLSKINIIFIYTLFFKSFQFLILYIFFKNKFIFNINDFLFTYLYFLLISLFVILAFAICNRYVAIVAIFLFAIVLYFNFNIYLSGFLLICLFLFIINLNLKKINNVIENK